MTNEKYKKLTLEEFTKAAEVYETDKAGIYKMCKKDYPDVLTELEHEPFEDLLDCGCGTAPMLTLLHDKYPEKHFTGIDLTPRMIEVARQKNMDGVELVVGDCENLPFDDDSFDAVICCQSFHHYPNVQDFFNSVYRVLRPGGRLILRDMTVNSDTLRWIMNKVEMPLINMTGHGDVHVYGKKEVRELCDNAGLKMEVFEKRKGMRLHCVARKPRADSSIQLGDVQETALIPLSIKANESRRSDPRIYDAKAIEIISRLGVDTEKYDKYFSHEGVVARTLLFDETVKKLLTKYPDAIVVNIGCGFDDRFSRTDNGIARWYHVDLPDSIEVRSKVFAPHERQTLIAGDITSDTWTKDIPDNKPAIIIAEGLFMYLTEDTVKALMHNIRAHFHAGFMLAELMSPLAVSNEKMHDTVKNTNAKFTYGVEDGKELESYCEGWKLIKETSFFEIMKRYSTVGKIGNLIAGKYMNRMALYRFRNK